MLTTIYIHSSTTLVHAINVLVILCYIVFTISCTLSLTRQSRKERHAFIDRVSLTCHEGHAHSVIQGTHHYILDVFATEEEICL